MVSLLWWLLALAGLVPNTLVPPEVSHIPSGKHLAFALKFFSQTELFLPCFTLRNSGFHGIFHVYLNSNFHIYLNPTIDS